MLKKCLMLLLVAGLSNNNINAFDWDTKGHEQTDKVICGSVVTMGAAGTYLIGSAIRSSLKKSISGPIVVKGACGILSLAAALGLFKTAFPPVFKP